MTERSSAQHQRQRSRNTLGRYARHNVCEMCGGNAGSHYYSLPDCDKTGIGVVLCRKCVKREAQAG